jgi:hypothetical protein
MKRNRVVLLILVLALLCICMVIGGLVAYLLLGWPPGTPSAEATATPAGPEATPVSISTATQQPTAAPARPTSGPDAPLSTEMPHNVVSGGQLPASHRVAFDGDDSLHLVWGNTQNGYLHQSMGRDALWRPAELLTGDFDTLFGLADLISDPEGRVCAFFDAATNSNVPSTSGMYMRCLADGQWSPVGELLARGDWLHPPAFAADGSVNVVELGGPGRAPVRFGDANLSSDEGYIHQLEFAIDRAGAYCAMWVRSAGEAAAVETRCSNDGGQTWSEIESLADLPPQSASLSLMSDEQGNLHAVSWGGAEGVYYKRWTPGAGWEPAIEVSGELVGGSWGDAAIGPDGLAHVVWGNDFADIKHYVHQRADGSWSQPRPITDETVTDVRLAIDSHGSRYFVWRGPDDGLYQITVAPATLTELGSIEGKLVVATDKAEYAPGEVVRISVSNNLDVPIWYAGQVDCGLSFWLLERCESGQVVQHQVPCMWAEAQHDFTQLDPGQALESEWPGSLQTYGDAGVLEELAEPGCYRVQFPFSLRPPWVTWGSDRMEVHSAAFTIR